MSFLAELLAQSLCPLEKMLSPRMPEVGVYSPYQQKEDPATSQFKLFTGKFLTEVHPALRACTLNSGQRFSQKP